MKQRISTIAVTAFLGIMGLLTLFLSTSVILDLFGIRAREGNYVPSVIWANFFSALLYLVAAVAFYKRKYWAAIPLIVSLAVLVIGAVLFIMHVQSGGPYETRTIGALIFRLTVNFLLAALVFYSQPRKRSNGEPIRNAFLALLPFAILLASCGTRSEHDHGGHTDADTTAHAHHHDADGQETLQLNNGEKWKADDHTLASVGRMKADIEGFEQSEVKDYRALSGMLRSELDTLIAGCTMKGPAHDELHKWLVPVTEDVKELSTAGQEDGQRVMDELKRSLEAFDATFKSEN